MPKKWGIRRIGETFGFNSKKDTNVYDCKETLRHVMMALDNELSEEEEKALLSHLNCCSRCLEKYEIEKSFKAFLTEKISRHTISSQMIVQIRSRILGKTDR